MNTVAKLIITILSIVTVIAIITGVYIHIFRGYGFRTASKSVEGREELEGEVTSIDFDVDFADVKIAYGDTFAVSYSMPENLVPKINIKDGVLSVKSTQTTNFSFPFNVSGDYEIVLTLPEGTELDDLSMNLDAGDITIKGIKATNLNMDVDAGDIKLSDIEADNFQIDVDAGNFEINGVNVQRMTIDVDAGNVDIRDSVIGTITADVDAGNIESHNSTISAGNCEVDMGNISLNGEIGDVKVKASLGNASVN